MKRKEWKKFITFVVSVSMVSSMVVGNASAVSIFEDIPDETVSVQFADAFETVDSEDMDFVFSEDKVTEENNVFENIEEEGAVSEEDALGGVFEVAEQVEVPLEYATVVLPVEFAEHTLMMEEDGVTWFLQTENYNDNAGGKMFGLTAIDKTTEIAYDQYMILAESEEFAYLWLEPTDVQYSENNRVIYAQMIGQTEAIRNTIVWADGIQAYEDPVLNTITAEEAEDVIFTEEDVLTEEELAVGTITITTQPLSVTKPIGEVAEFSVQALGTDLKYQWYVSSSGTSWSKTSLTGYSTNTLKVPVTNARNGYWYRCVITDSSSGSVTTDKAQLIVGVPGPKITSQPENFSGPMGTNAEFTVTAEGTGLTYQWYVSSSGTSWSKTSLTGCTTNKLTVGITSARNGLYYRCAVTDSTGVTVNTDKAQLTIGSASETKITSQPVDFTGPVGTNAVFTVTAEGAGLAYQWYVSSKGTSWSKTSLPGCTTNELTVAITSGRNGYYYRCVVTDASGKTVTSNKAQLTVGEAALSITKQPVSVAGSIGTNAVFEVGATGNGLTYQWYVSSKGTSWSKTSLPGCTTNELTVAITSGRNGYYYRCVVSDASGKSVTSNSAQLTVGEKKELKIISQPTDATVNAGETATFTVVAEGEGLSYQWYVSAKGTSWSKTSLSGCTTSTLRVAANATRDRYFYRCEVKDASGKTVTSTAGQLIIDQGLSIITQPKSVTVPYGDNAKFTVAASGDGLTYQWEYCTASGSTWRNYDGKTAATLSVKSEAKRDGWKFRCKVSNGTQTVTSSVATLTVSEPFAKGAIFVNASGSYLGKAEATYFEGKAGLPAGWVVYIPRSTIEKTASYYTYSVNGSYLNLEAVVEGYSAVESDLNLFFYVTDEVVQVTAQTI